MFRNVASFPKIITNFKNSQLVVTDIIQKAGIEVNEEGTTAFAATGNLMSQFFDKLHFISLQTFK